MIDLLLMSGAVSSRTLNTLNQWAAGVQKTEDLHVENYWDYLAEILEQPDKLHSVEQVLHAPTWCTIHSVYLNIADGHALAKHHVKRCIFLDEICTRNPTHAVCLPRKPLERKLTGIDFAEA